MKAKWLGWLFLLAVLAQLAVPASMIARREQVLRRGQAFRFRTAPVDPYDAFRGRYVALRFEQTSVPVPADHEFRSGQKVFARIAEDADGFASFAGIARRCPRNEPYLATRLHNVSGTNAVLQIPFDRLYMEESEAPAAEVAYRRHSSGSNRAAFVQVRIWKGLGVIEDLYIDQMPIRQFLANAATNTPR